jgi:hypothetical protein
MPIQGRREQQVQRSVVEHLRYRGARGAVWWHCPNGGYRRPAEAKIMAGLGVRGIRFNVAELH